MPGVFSWGQKTNKGKTRHPAILTGCLMFRTRERGKIVRKLVYPTKSPVDIGDNFDIMTEYDKAVVESIYIFVWKTLFGKTYPSNLMLAITNKKTADIPYFNVSPQGVPYINLAIKSFDYWCQVAFQFSHEFAHWLMYEISGNITVSASWLEEMIAEAFSLYVLKKLQIAWNYCKLSERNALFSESIKKYLDDLLAKTGTNAIENCNSVQKLDELNKTSESNRENHYEERKKLFYLLDETNVFGLFDYKRFCIQSSCSFDEAKYRKTYPNNLAVRYVCDLQKNINKNQTQK